MRLKPGRAQIARSKGVEELHQDDRKRLILADARAAAEQRLAAECTFQPDTQKPVIPEAQYLCAHAAFSIHDQPVEELVQRCVLPAVHCREW